MLTRLRNDINKYYLMICELHYPEIHGKTDTSDPNIETHYLVYNIYDTITGISLYHADEFMEYDTEQEYDSDSESVIYDNRIIKIDDDIKFLRDMYSNPINIQYFMKHPVIRNYHNIVSKSNYIKPEIGEYIILPTQEAIAILKTFWIRIIQKKWKKIFQQRKTIIKQRCYLSNLSIREIKGLWPESCINLPGLKGMLSDLKK